MEWLILVAVVVVVIAIGVVAVPQIRSRALKQRFGLEYDHAVVETAGDRRDAETQLRERVKRRDTLEIRDLEPVVREAYADRWLEVQQRFIDAPVQTVVEADELVQAVMRERGYPVDGFDERIEMVTVDHPDLAENYRVAHAVQLRSDEASTDELRDAFQRYRSLFAELLAEGRSDDSAETESEADEADEANEARDDHHDDDLPERDAS